MYTKTSMLLDLVCKTMELEDGLAGRNGMDFVISKDTSRGPLQYQL